MGKEIHRPQEHGGLGKRIGEITGKVGLSVAVMGTGLGAIDCAKKPVPPQSPTGITENSPQFPSSGNDRPLQSRQQSAEKGTLPSAFSEKALEDGWKSRQSLNFPYRINIPPGWTMNSIQAGGQKQDSFREEGTAQVLKISSEPIRKGITLNDYTDNFLAQIKQANLYAEDTSETKAKLAKKRTGEPETSYGWVPYTFFGSDEIIDKIAALSKTRIANQETKIFMVTGTERNSVYPQELCLNDDIYHGIVAISTTEGQAWTITLTFPLTKEENALATLDTFQKMLLSLKLTK